ncbi:MAG TPA: NAD-dependent epimerase/dehydratase family protein [Ramlibacter sp.]|nr:NAD-dependent epimerase/dehydratase family protein [Ramlibacter sp.]
MRIAITGASGFIGRALVAAARDAGHGVDALSRSGGADYEDAAAMSKGFAGADAVVHLAARAHRRGPGKDFDCNVRSTRAVAAASRAAGVGRLVLVSSIGVNGNVTRGKPFTETDTPAPAEPYAHSKLASEREVQAAGIDWVVIRPPLVYGPRAPGNFGLLVRAVARNWPLPLGAIHNQRSLIGVQNLCEFIMACATQPLAANELFLIADGDDVSTPDIVRSIAKGLGKPARLWNLPPSLIRLAGALPGRKNVAQGLCDSLQVDASKARTLLGWSPAVATREGIAHAAAGWGHAP